MSKELAAQEVRRALHCLEVLQSVQKGARTPGWYRGEVRGKEAIGTATDYLMRKNLIQSTDGLQPFRLTKKGKEFFATVIKDWKKFMETIDQPKVVERFAKALASIKE